MPDQLPEPDCPSGYTQQQVQQIMGPRYDAFNHWMRGQTAPYCDGEGWDCTKKHGPCVYQGDVRNFLQGGDPFD